MRETKQLLNLNFKLFGKFAKLFMKLEEHLNPLVGDAEKLRREYQTYCNKRPTRGMRGLDFP